MLKAVKKNPLLSIFQASKSLKTFFDENKNPIPLYFVSKHLYFEEQRFLDILVLESIINE